MKRLLTISLMLLAIFSGLAFFRFLATTKNILEINPFSAVGTIHESPLQELPPLFNFSSTPLKGEEEGQINILFLGSGGKDHPGGNLTDTVLVGSISLEDRSVAKAMERRRPKKATLFSIPRDFYVNPVPEQVRYGARVQNANTWTKINAVYPYGGIDSLKSVVEEIMGLPIDYWLGLNFDQFIKIIDDLGGLSIYVEEDIYDPLFPGPNYSYEAFKLSQGWHYLDGETALKYVRSRYSSGGDFDRTHRQQQILEALRIKLRSPKSFLDIRLVSTLFNALTSDLKTDIELSEMGRFYSLANEIWPRLIENKIIDINESGLLTGQDHPTAGSILIPKAGIGNYGEIRRWVEGLVHKDEP